MSTVAARRGRREVNRLRQLRSAGVSIWLDTLSRDMLDSGAFARLIADCAVTGATSNPTIFAKAITGSDRYDAQLGAAVAPGIHDPQELFFTRPWTTSAAPRTCCAPSTARAPVATGSSRSSAHRISPTMPRRRSSRPSACGSAWPGAT